MNTYAAYHVLHGGLDPWGLEVTAADLQAITADGHVSLQEAKSLDFSGQQASQLIVNVLGGSAYQYTATEIWNIWFSDDSPWNDAQRDKFRAKYPGLSDKEICFKRAEERNIMKARLTIKRLYDPKLNAYMVTVGPTSELILMAGNIPLLVTAPLRPKSTTFLRQTRIGSNLKPLGKSGALNNVPRALKPGDLGVPPGALKELVGTVKQADEVLVVEIQMIKGTIQRPFEAISSLKDIAKSSGCKTLKIEGTIGAEEMRFVNILLKRYGLKQIRGAGEGLQDAIVIPVE